MLFLTLYAARTGLLTAQSEYPLIISGGAHALTFPWYPGQIGKRLNPSLIIGSERTLKPAGRVRLYHAANLGFFRHYWWVTNVYLDTELGVSRELPYGFQADLKAGIGYMHTFWRRETLKLKDGKYVHATDWGRPSAMIPLSIVFGHRGGAVRGRSLSPFVAMQWIIQAPFIEEAPAMTHLLVQFGVRIGRRGASPAGGN